jgi:epoxide hydrolase-like predicted phosphatase
LEGKTLSSHIKQEKKRKMITNSNAIEAVIFDVGGVLSLGKDLGQIKKRKDGVHEKIAKKLNISLDQWFDALGEKYNQVIAGRISEKEFISGISKTFNVFPNLIKNLFLKGYKDNYRQNLPLYHFAFKLKKKGYKIAILSDQHPLSKKVLIPKEKIKHFNPVIISCDVGFKKPDPRIYTLILKRLKLKPKQVVFIDNQSWNLPPARKLGIKTILFKTNKQLFKQLTKLGVKI